MFKQRVGFWIIISTAVTITLPFAAAQSCPSIAGQWLATANDLSAFVITQDGCSFHGSFYGMASQVQHSVDGTVNGSMTVTRVKKDGCSCKMYGTLSLNGSNLAWKITGTDGTPCSDLPKTYTESRVFVNNGGVDAGGPPESCTLSARGGEVWLALYQENTQGRLGSFMMSVHLAKDETKGISAPGGRIRYLYKAVESDPMHGETGAWCHNNDVVRVS
jgi:hypothetical protein